MTDKRILEVWDGRKDISGISRQAGDFYFPDLSAEEREYVQSLRNATYPGVCDVVTHLACEAITRRSNDAL